MSVERWVPVDVETTGLDPQRDLLLEIQVFVIEPRAPYVLDLADGFHAVIQNDAEQARDLALPYVREMHDRTGLWNRLPAGEPLEYVDSRLLFYLRERFAYREGFLVGNSVRLDQNFIEHHLPRSFEYLHYRSIDVTSIAMWARHQFDVPQFPKSVDHTATGDILATMAELDWINAHLHRLPDVGEHEWDRDLICRRCGHGATAAELLRGNTPCQPRKEQR